MTLRTGTSQNGVIHRYYTCSTCVSKGKSACKGRSIRMDKLDGLVTQHLIERLFEPGRLATILDSLATRRTERAKSVNSRIMALQREVVDAEDRLRRLYRLVEDDVTDLDDVLKDRLNSLEAERPRPRSRPPSRRLPFRSVLIPHSSSNSAAACGRSSPPDRCRSGKAICSPSSKSSRWTTARFASNAAKMCWNVLFLPDGPPLNLVRR